MISLLFFNGQMRVNIKPQWLDGISRNILPFFGLFNEPEAAPGKMKREVIQGYIEKSDSEYSDKS
jgi:hypothetical protein